MEIHKEAKRFFLQTAILLFVAMAVFMSTNYAISKHYAKDKNFDESSILFNIGMFLENPLVIQLKARALYRKKSNSCEDMKLYYGKYFLSARKGIYSQDAAKEATKYVNIYLGTEACVKNQGHINFVPVKQNREFYEKDSFGNIIPYD